MSNTNRQYGRFAEDRNRIDGQALHQRVEHIDRSRQEGRLAFQNGIVAHDAGRPIDESNPYKKGSPAFATFRAGWEDADSALAAMVLPPYDYAIKSWPQFFEPMVAGRKLHDMRDKRDRDYKVGDRMLLREWDQFGGGYTGRVALAVITYITSNDTPCAMSSVGLGRDMAILSVRVSGPYPDDDRNA